MNTLLRWLKRYFQPSLSEDVNQDKLFTAQVEMIYAFKSKGLAIGSLVAGALLVVVLYVVIEDKQTLFVWYGLFVALQLPRMFVTRAFALRKPPFEEYKKWGAYILMVQFLVGVSWGLLGIMVVPIVPDLYRLLIMALLAGVAGLVANTSSVWMTVATVTNLPLLTPVIIYFFFYGDYFHFMMGLMLIALFIIKAGAMIKHKLFFVRTITLSQQLKDSEEKFRHAFEKSVVGIALADAEGKFIKVNKPFCDIFGYSEQELHNLSINKLTHPDYVQNTMESIKKLLVGEVDSIQTKKKYIRKDGSTIWGRVSVSLAQDTASNMMYLIAHVEDITEQKKTEADRRQLEEQMQKAQTFKSMGVLAGGVAHDFNNMLTAILGNAYVALIDLPETEPARKYVENIKGAAKRATELSNQMLAYSGKGKFVIDTIDINKIIKEMTNLISSTISKKIVVHFKLKDSPLLIDADATQIRQIVLNLITNATESIGDNSGKIILSTKAVKCDEEQLRNVYFNEDVSEGDYAMLEVTDTGMGMDKETLEKVFDPFFTTKFTGRGLGMSSVLGIINGHKGAINVESKLGHGARFTILLPRSKEKKPTLNNFDTEELDDWNVSGTILIVDDEQSVSDVASDMIEKLGLNTLVVNDGLSAIEIFRKNASVIDCVLLDLSMPLMDGKECLKELQKIRKDVKVILTSGYDKHEFSQRMTDSGIVGFVQKPFSMVSLKRAIMSALERKVANP